MASKRYFFDVECPPVLLSEVLAIALAEPDVQLAYEETLTWDAGAAVGLVRIESGSSAVLEALYRWWQRKQRAIAFPFDIYIRVGNRVRVSFRDLPLARVRERVEAHQDTMIARLTEG